MTSSRSEKWSPLPDHLPSFFPFLYSVKDSTWLRPDQPISFFPFPQLVVEIHICIIDLSVISSFVSVGDWLLTQSLAWWISQVVLSGQSCADGWVFLFGVSWGIVSPLDEWKMMEKSIVFLTYDGLHVGSFAARRHFVLKLIIWVLEHERPTSL